MDRNILSKAAKTVADEVVDTIEIPLFPKNLFDRLCMAIGLKRKSLRFELRKIRVGARWRITARAVKLPVGLFDKNNFVRSFMDASAKYSDDLVYVAAVALQNDRNEPKPELIDALNMLDDEAFADILDKSISMLDIQAFMKTIALIIGTENLTEKEPEPETT